MPGLTPALILANFREKYTPISNRLVHETSYVYGRVMCYNGSMRKLIVKSQLAERAGLDQQLVNIGMELSPVIWQHERVYLPHDYRPDMNFPRLVMRTEVHAVNQTPIYAMYLKRHIEDSGIDWVNYTEVKDYTEASGMIHQLGFRKVAEISRQRQELWLDDKTVIYVDKVEGLPGYFIKLEAELVDGEPVDLLRRDLFSILQMFGQETFTMQTYFSLLKGESEAFFLPE